MLSDTDKAKLAIVPFIHLHGEANWTQQIVPHLKDLGLRPLTAAMLQLREAGVIVWTAPGTHKLADDYIVRLIRF